MYLQKYYVSIMWDVEVKLLVYFMGILMLCSSMLTIEEVSRNLARTTPLHSPPLLHWAAFSETSHNERN